MEKTCSQLDCAKSPYCKGLCKAHYARLRRYGDPSTKRVMGPPRRSLWDRFWPKVDAEGDCWEWNAPLRVDGYGTIGRGGIGEGQVLAHRAAWELLIGPIPEGLQLDHLCRNRGCVNPDHLEPVTHGENLRRGLGGRLKPKRTECSAGHPLSGTNLRIDRGRRACRECARGWERAWRERQKNRPPT